MKRTYLCLVLLLFFAAACQQEDVLSIEEHAAEGPEEIIIKAPDEPMDAEFVTYGDNFKGYFVAPKKNGSFPGVVMIHEWWGLNQNIKNRAHDLAEEGFLVLAVDLYDGKVADISNDARTYATTVRNDMDTAIAHLKSAVAFLRNHERSLGNVASLGWCFGGGLSLQLALQEQMDATVIYYGAVETDPEVLASIDWPILGIFGEEDRVIPLDAVHAFASSLEKVGIEHEIYTYPGQGHAFANPSNAGYDPISTAHAWMKTVDFLQTHLR